MLVSLTPHIAAYGAYVFIALRAEGALPYTFEVSCLIFFMTSGTFCLFFKQHTPG